MKMFVVNRRVRDEAPISLGVGSSEGIPPVGSLLQIEVAGRLVGFEVVKVVIAKRDELTGVFLVCDPYRCPPETPESIENGRHPWRVVDDVFRDHVQGEDA